MCGFVDEQINVKFPKLIWSVNAGLDNICRSPIAEAVLHAAIVKDGLQAEWHVDSAAIEAWHLGAPPDERALRVLQKNKIEYHNRARRLKREDFEKFDFIVGMDQSIMASLRLLEPHYAKAKLLMLGDFMFGLKPSERIIDDPYYVSWYIYQHNIVTP